MTELVFHHNPKYLPPTDDHCLAVQLYGRGSKGRNDISIIGNPVIERVKRLGVRIPGQIMDFLTIALAVTAADTFVSRSEAEDGWTRRLTMQLPLWEPARWIPLKKELEHALHFLSGDIWEFDFREGGFPSPEPYKQRDRFQLIRLRGLDCVCLFSGGLDSAIGAIDLFALGRTPLLVSHAYKGDKKHQDQIAKAFGGLYSRFEVNADPHRYAGDTDITMRTRSLNFLAFAAVGAYAVQVVSQQDKVDLFVPENGFISLNVPLTSRRIGTLSTRTTHPHFIESIQGIFDAANIRCRITNPYQFKTKGEMTAECKNRQLLRYIVNNTVSCSHWKRSNQQCGICVPCIIRRSALYAGSISEDNNYAFPNITDVLNETDRRDDVLALRIAASRKNTSKTASWIANSGPLPFSNFRDFQRVFLAGLDEIEAFLSAEDVL